MYIYMNYTKHGYEIAVIGESEQHRPLRGHERRPHHDAHHVPLRRDLPAWSASSLPPARTTPSTTASPPASASPPSPWRGSAQLNAFAMIVISIMLADPVQGRRNASDPSGTCPPRSPTSSPASCSSVMLGCEFFINYQTHLPRRRRTRKGGGNGMTLLITLIIAAVTLRHARCCSARWARS